MWSGISLVVVGFQCWRTSMIYLLPLTNMVVPVSTTSQKIKSLWNLWDSYNFSARTHLVRIYCYPKSHIETYTIPGKYTLNPEKPEALKWTDTQACQVLRTPPRTAGPRANLQDCTQIILTGGDVAKTLGFLIYQQSPANSSCQVGQVLEILVSNSTKKPLGLLVQHYNVGQDAVLPYQLPALKKANKGPTLCQLQVSTIFCCVCNMWIQFESPGMHRNGQCHSQFCCS